MKLNRFIIPNINKNLITLDAIKEEQEKLKEAEECMKRSLEEFNFLETASFTAYSNEQYLTIKNITEDLEISKRQQYRDKLFGLFIIWGSHPETYDFLKSKQLISYDHRFFIEKYRSQWYCCFVRRYRYSDDNIFVFLPDDPIYEDNNRPQGYNSPTLAMLGHYIDRTKLIIETMEKVLKEKEAI